ncbi:MAG: putative peroxiredoxin [Rhodobacteraceae bacterium HLUCCA12]|nr:MAG: putative peroxiredoxin [Rhodobacteraceae bacterium HLUCCA12]
MAKELVALMSHGPTDERASVGFTIVNGGLTAGLSASVFLTADAVDIARRGAADLVHAHPMEPLKDLLADFLSRGGTLWACPPCVKARGYGTEDLIDGVEIVGASAMHARIKAGAAALSF